MHAMKKTCLTGTWLVRAPRSDVYRVITDFANAPKYFPSVAKSARIIRREGNHLTVEVETKAFLGSRTYRVQMDAELRPPEGFVSVNTSSLGVEHEVFMMEEVPGGTMIRYTNDVEIKSPLFRMLGGLLLGKLALKYWERAVIGKLKQMLDEVIRASLSSGGPCARH